MSHDPLQNVSSKTIYRNAWISVHEDETLTPEGDKGTYAYLESRNSCMVVAVNELNEIYLVHGFRYPSKSYGWELPGGGGDNEDPLHASQRELEEETGIRATTWEKLGEAYVCNGLMTEQMTIYLAQGLTFDGQKEHSSEHFDGMRFFTQAEINDMIVRGTINDCQTLAGLQYYMTWQQTKETA